MRWSSIAIEPEWIDYNGHLNMAAYLVVFDRAIDRLIERVGLSASAGPEPTLYALSAKLDYLREIAADERPECVTGVVALDDKRLHSWQELRVGSEVRARCENLHIHVDRTGPKATPFASEVRERLLAMREAPPPWLGMTVAHRLRGA